MPTSLVSTGVQFPDSTIQTTAATGGPNWTTAGTTLFFVSSLNNNNNTPAIVPSGLILGSTNILTTAPVYVNPLSLEYQSGQGTGTTVGGGANNILIPNSAEGISHKMDYAVNPRLLRDGFTGRYVMSAAQATSAGSSTTTRWGTTYSTDLNNWLSIKGASSSTNATNSAFNNYTGTRVYTVGIANFMVYTNTAATAYDWSAGSTNSINTYSWADPNYIYVGPPAFIDTGSQSTSRFIIYGYDDNSYMWVLRSATGGALGNWTATNTYLNSSYFGRIVGNSTEIMAYSYNKGMYRSTDMGVSIGRFNFADNSGGGAAGDHPTSTAWNGTYWLCITSYENNKLVSRLMGSGTTFTRLTNTGIANGNWSSVAYNPTLGVWLAVNNEGDLYSNSNSNPTAGTWSYVRTILRPQTTSDFSLKMYVVAAATNNF